MAMHSIRGPIRFGLAAGGVTAALVVALAPAASASIGTPSVTLTPSSAPAGLTANLGTDIKFSPTGGDSTRDLTLELPPGLIANASIDNGACLKTSTPTTACQVGTGTVTATENELVPLPLTLNATFDLVAPPSPSDLAGLQTMVLPPGSGTPTPLGTPAAVSLRSASDPAGEGLTIAFANIPDSFDGLPISLDEINSTFDGLRFPSTCPGTPADVIVTAESYGDATPHTGSAPLQVTGCASLPYAPAFTVTATRDASDQGVTLTTDITQTANQATSRSVSLAFPGSVLSPNLVVVSVLCANPASGTCTAVGSAKAVSPVYPMPLVGQAYLTGSLTAPALTLVFPAPFSLELTGQVKLASNSTTFSGLPDFPLTDLAVTLTGGSHAVFEASCRAASGTATASLTSQNGDQAVVVSTPFTVAGCGTLVGGGKPAAPSRGGRPRIHAASLSGLAAGKPALRFQLVAGASAPKLSSFTVELPKGLSFVRHRVHKALKLIGLSLSGARRRSAALRHGHLVITLRKPVDSLTLRVSDQALRESAGLRSKARHGKLKSLKLKVIVRNAAGRSSTLTLTLR
jgi:hypothetical protein